MSASHAVRSASQPHPSALYVDGLPPACPRSARLANRLFQLIRVGGVRARPIPVGTSLSLR